MSKKAFKKAMNRLRIVAVFRGKTKKVAIDGVEEEIKLYDLYRRPSHV